VGRRRGGGSQKKQNLGAEGKGKRACRYTRKRAWPLRNRAKKKKKKKTKKKRKKKKKKQTEAGLGGILDEGIRV